MNRPKIPAYVQRQVALEAGDRCAVCGNTSSLEFAHITPYSETLDHSPENLLYMCANCHTKADEDKWPRLKFQGYKESPWVLRPKFGRVPPASNWSLVECKIKTKIADFNPDVMRHALASFLRISVDEIEIQSIAEGSVIVSFKLPKASAHTLLDAWENSDPILLELISGLDAVTASLELQIERVAQSLTDGLNSIAASNLDLAEGLKQSLDRITNWQPVPSEDFWQALKSAPELAELPSIQAEFDRFNDLASTLLHERMSRFPNVEVTIKPFSAADALPPPGSPKFPYGFKVGRIRKDPGQDFQQKDPEEPSEDTKPLKRES